MSHSVAWTEARFSGVHRAPLAKRYVRDDGSIVEATVSTALVEPEGSEPYLFSQVQDVTEQRRAARQEEAIAELTRRALECADVAAMLEEAMQLVREKLGTANCITNCQLASGEIHNVAVAGDVVEFSIPPGVSSRLRTHSG